MDRIENDNNNNGLGIYSNATNVIERPSLNVPWNDANAANNFVAPMTVNGHIDFTQGPFNEAQYNENLPRSVMDTASFLPDNFFNMTFNPPLQMPTNDSEIFRFAIPGFQIIVIPMSSPRNH